jgi:hypothetical protein
MRMVAATVATASKVTAQAVTAGENRDRIIADAVCRPGGASFRIPSV